MAEPVDMDEAIAATEKLFPPATAKLLAARFQGVLEVAAIHPGLIDMAVVESAREVLALAEQQNAPASAASDEVLHHLDIRVQEGERQ